MCLLVKLIIVKKILLVCFFVLPLLLAVCYVDTNSGSIKLRGKKERVEKLQTSVRAILQQRGHDNIEHVKKTRGCSAYLGHLAAEEAVRYPRYWKCVQKGTADKKTRIKRSQLDPQSPEYKEIESLLLRTWEKHKVSQGQDAVNLHHSGIVVKKIYSVENPVLYRKYDAKKKEICANAAARRCPSVKGLQGESDIMTHRHGM